VLGAVIDCDVHQNFSRLDELLPWVDPAFRHYLERGGYSGYQLPNYPWVHPGGFMMADAVPEGGGVPGSDYPTLRAQLLDRHDLDYAILTGEDILNVSAMAHPELAAALASAYNRWLVETWLTRDPRLRGSLVIAAQDAIGAAAEIRTAGAHPDIVQVIVSSGARLAYGDPHYLPIYEAAAELGLPVAIHVGAEGLGVNPPPTAAGYPAYYFEWHTLLPATVMAHLVSLIANGTFERVPGLRVVLVETGVAWLPGLLWRLDANWKALRSEVPWVTRLPSEIVREHISFTTQPLEQPRSNRDLHACLKLIDGLADSLMYASDYPHWDVDPPEVVIRRLPEEWRDRVMDQNARRLYGLPARSEIPPLAATA
jgi:predicted TIM-barrel fold metal-dependent hydrolase